MDGQFSINQYADLKMDAHISLQRKLIVNDRLMIMRTVKNCIQNLNRIACNYIWTSDCQLCWIYRLLSVHFHSAFRVKSSFIPLSKCWDQIFWMKILWSLSQWSFHLSYSNSNISIGINACSWCLTLLCLLSVWNDYYEWNLVRFILSANWTRSIYL